MVLNPNSFELPSGHVPPPSEPASASLFSDQAVKSEPISIVDTLDHRQRGSIEDELSSSSSLDFFIDEIDFDEFAIQSAVTNLPLSFDPSVRVWLPQHPHVLSMDYSVDGFASAPLELHDHFLRPQGPCESLDNSLAVANSLGIMSPIPIVVMADHSQVSTDLNTSEKVESRGRRKPGTNPGITHYQLFPF
jgi:hypothetical protein